MTNAPDHSQQPDVPAEPAGSAEPAASTTPDTSTAAGATTSPDASTSADASAEPDASAERAASAEPAESAEPAAQTDPEPVEVASHDEVTVRRAPKYPVFLIMGALAGVIVSLIVTSLFPFQEGEGVASTYGYFSLWGLTFGGAIGSLVAIVVDRMSIRRAKSVTAERSRVDAPDEPVEGDIES